MKRKMLALLMVAALAGTTMTACHDSSQKTASKDVKETGYDVEKEIKAFKMGELNETEKDYQIEMGYFNCDHMVASIIGEKAGIYEALGLNVNVTKSAETIKALTSGAMDCGYLGINGAIKAVNEGAPFHMAAANHLGGSYYLVVSNDIQKPEDLIGKKLAIGNDADQSPDWLTWTAEMGIDPAVENYEIIEMSQADAGFAMKAGQLDGFMCCDPYASLAEFEGYGHVMKMGYNAVGVSSDSDIDDWGICCIYGMSNSFKENCPELARRLVFAHELAVKYMYEHPYNAAMMFADGFGVDPYVGLRTIYLKTVSEGRTLTWEFSEKNIEHYIEYFSQFPQIPEEDIPTVDNVHQFMSTELIEEAGLEDFQAYIKETVDPVFPLGMTFEDWYNKAKEIDDISDKEAIDIADTATPYLNEDVKEETK
ncbi:MAG: ABC transporter substrate-binding protein [Lachnospiraceae bacterium]|mgnify:CR=1 FL=1|nr:ABC transporter substrate-binding protein [Lachnospiraceae bacterium]